MNTEEDLSQVVNDTISASEIEITIDDPSLFDANRNRVVSIPRVSTDTIR
jgi:hypothetical protein